ncbi:acetyl-CoA carboxylase biotin carboxyl carrier protein subunit [Pseudomonas kairouanensis]|uniref:Biotin carboxyl carrier protein of acetyl-CoA carboxylase n=1 Tax=Pseudomonas kairouanensis TaxID=2293832 RepID=A0A4Z0AJ76_9PSED|nr:acetyl-CoA carboxylase biotin carboxyl carrier protein subunit [Pseudomonas kairouanensis]TFY86832.1 acetyl-CoA carboxylase biotin carboxyl carrier protein subunit [Pseudomonas kairouanensis]
MDSARIKGLMDLLAESDLLELSLTEGDSTLRLFKQAGQAVVTSVAPSVIAVPPKAASPSAIEIKASLYGVLHLTPAVGEPPFVTVGQAIEAGQTVAVIEAMKMFHPVKAKAAGKLVEILAQAGVEVEAGQALFRLG